MSKKVLNFGIIGCGIIATTHAECLSVIDSAHLVGVTDKKYEYAESFAEKFNIKPYASYEEMLADENIDAICVCTPSGLHYENSLQALAAGKHVVLEKPMAFTYEECKRIEKAAEENNCVLTVISQLRFSDDIRKVKKLVEENAFGQIVFCDLYLKNWRDTEYYTSSNWKGTKKYDGGGALMNQGIHGVDLLLYLVGDAKVITAKKRAAFHNIEVEDQVIAMLEFDNGAMGVLEASTCAYPGYPRRIEIIGTKGSVVLIENKIERLVVNGETYTSDDVEKTADKPKPGGQLHILQLENFINAVFGEDELAINAADGARAVSLIERIYNA